MNTEEFRSVQAPLKERYREATEMALITLRAQGRLGEGVSCKIETGKALVVAGLRPRHRRKRAQRLFRGHAARGSSSLRWGDSERRCNGNWH